MKLGVLLVGLVLADAAGAEPSMTVTGGPTANINDYLPESPGLERLWQYTITNTSPLGDVNNMIRWELPIAVADLLGVEVIYDGFEGCANANLTGLAGWTGSVPSSAGENVVFFRCYTAVGVAAVPAQASAVALGDAEGTRAFSPVMVEVPGEVGLKVRGYEFRAVDGGMEVDLEVDAEGGRFVVNQAVVEHAASLAGPWEDVGTISGDGQTFSGTVAVPGGPRGFVRVKVP